VADHLSGKVVVVTGGARGVGRAVAEAASKQGAAVVINDLGGALDGTGRDSTPAREAAAEIVSRGGRAHANADTVATMEGARNLVAEALAAFGRLDAIVMCAGNSSTAPFWEMSEAQWDSLISVHLKGHFACTRAAAAPMMAQKSGRIIHITSHVGLYGHPEAANYAAAKAGITGLTRSAAQALGPFGITVNAIAPSAISRMSDTVAAPILRERAAARGIPLAPDLTDDEVRLKLIGDPRGVGNFAAYLCGDDASHVNGEVFAVIGGHIGRFAPWNEAATLDTDGFWSVEALREAAPSALFAGLINPAPPSA
jgi:NAD(P)-dependent dehydrogenase (short-subunit alcohol dehydrogenase family)